ncbi:hypothetical protein DFH09DRAFT_1125805, partial [Mycena vulgaris]
CRGRMGSASRTGMVLSILMAIRITAQLSSFPLRIASSHSSCISSARCLATLVPIPSFSLLSLFVSPHPYPTR